MLDFYSILCYNGPFHCTTFIKEGSSLFYKTVTTEPVNFVAINGTVVRTLQGDPERLKSVLTKWNEEGFGIYFVPATLKSKRRTKTNFKKTKCLWMDQDSPGAPDFPFPPTAIVQTSANKYHYYWKLSTHLEDGDQLEMLNRSIATTHGGDTAACDRTRLLRCPEFANQKNGFDVVVEELHPERVYDVKDFKLTYPPVVSEAVVGDGPESESDFDMEANMMKIFLGESVHEPRAAIAMSLANFNVPKSAIVGILNSTIRAGHTAGNIDEVRYRDRMGNNNQVVASAHEKIANEARVYIVDATDKVVFTDLPKPYGALESITQDIIRNMFYENATCAIPIAFHLIGTFGGGMYSYNGVTAARKRTLCMKSGAGKDITSQFVDACINEIEAPEARMFRGSSTFAHTTVHHELVDFRCRSYLISEAGQKGKSDLGDSHHMRAYLLQLLSAKVGRSVSPTATKQMFKDKDNVPLTVQNPVVSILAESPPEVYAEYIAMTDSARSGDLSREELIFPDPTITTTNWMGFQRPSQKTIDIFTNMAQNFIESGETTGRQQRNPFTNVPCEIERVFREYHDDAVLPRRNEQMSPLIESCYTRLFEKVKATAMLLAVLDGALVNQPPIITQEHFDYSVKYHEAIIEGLKSQSNATDGAFQDNGERCMAMLCKNIEEYPSKARDADKSVNVAKRLVRRGWFSQIFKTGDPAFKSLCDNVFHGNTNGARKSLIAEALDKELIFKGPDAHSFYLAKLKNR